MLRESVQQRLKRAAIETRRRKKDLDSALRKWVEVRDKSEAAEREAIKLKLEQRRQYLNAIAGDISQKPQHSTKRSQADRISVMPCSKYSSKDTRKGKRKEPPSAGCQGDKNRTAEIEADGSPENVRQRYQIAKAKAAEELRRLLQNVAGEETQQQIQQPRRKLDLLSSGPLDSRKDHCSSSTQRDGDGQQQQQQQQHNSGSVSQTRYARCRDEAQPTGLSQMSRSQLIDLVQEQELEISKLRGGEGQPVKLASQLPKIESQHLKGSLLSEGTKGVSPEPRSSGSGEDDSLSAKTGVNRFPDIAAQREEAQTSSTHGQVISKDRILDPVPDSPPLRNKANLVSQGVVVSTKVEKQSLKGLIAGAISSQPDELNDIEATKSGLALCSISKTTDRLQGSLGFRDQHGIALGVPFYPYQAPDHHAMCPPDTSPRVVQCNMVTALMAGHHPEHGSNMMGSPPLQIPRSVLPTTLVDDSSRRNTEEEAESRSSSQPKLPPLKGLPPPSESRPKALQSGDQRTHSSGVDHQASLISSDDYTPLPPRGPQLVPSRRKPVEKEKASVDKPPAVKHEAAMRSCPSRKGKCRAVKRAGDDSNNINKAHFDAGKQRQRVLFDEEAKLLRSLAKLEVELHKGRSLHEPNYQSKELIWDEAQIRQSIEKLEELLLQQKRQPPLFGESRTSGKPGYDDDHQGLLRPQKALEHSAAAVQAFKSKMGLLPRAQKLEYESQRTNAVYNRHRKTAVKGGVIRLTPRGVLELEPYGKQPRYY